MIRVLVISDDIWHPGEVIVRGLKGLENGGISLDHVMAARDIVSPGFLRRYDVVINAKTDQHSPANKEHAWFDRVTASCMPEDIEEYVREGHGFIALHSGNSFRSDKTPGMTSLIGNEFIGHPPQCDITVNPVLRHPVTEGIEPFEIHDEHYMIRLLQDDLTVFLESVSDSEAGTQAAGYERKVGKGVVIALTPGHTLAVLENPMYQKLLTNAILYAASFSEETHV